MHRMSTAATPEKLWQSISPQSKPSPPKRLPKRHRGILHPCPGGTPPHGFLAAEPEALPEGCTEAAPRHLTVMQCKQTGSVHPCFHQPRCKSLSQLPEARSRPLEPNASKNQTSLRIQQGPHAYRLLFSWLAHPTLLTQHASVHRGSGRRAGRLCGVWRRSKKLGYRAHSACPDPPEVQQSTEGIRAKSDESNRCRRRTLQVHAVGWILRDFTCTQDL